MVSGIRKLAFLTLHTLIKIRRTCPLLQLYPRRVVKNSNSIIREERVKRPFNDNPVQDWAVKF